MVFPNLKKYPITHYQEKAKCGICGKSHRDRHLDQYWISLKVANDILPLLVHICSDDCKKLLPKPPVGYAPGAHLGGPELLQQKSWYEI